MNVLPWYIAGPLLGITIPLLLVLYGKQLGVSSSFRVLGSFILPKVDYFNYDRKQDLWQLYFIVGLVFAAFASNYFGLNKEPNVILPEFVESSAQIYSAENWVNFLFGGFLIGFGARYAGGCTAGHCLMGNSLFATSSLLSTVSFFIGGLLITHLVIPYIF
jgi:uncharacterized membrane protein YedE/YeeE